jgi:DNA-binding transcriptional ArsR family regulator
VRAANSRACVGAQSVQTLNYMVQYASPSLDRSFAALSDATRRGVLQQLGRSDSSITSLAEKFDMTLTGMKKHVSVLERAGLITTEKVGRVRTCRLDERALAAEAEWIEAQRKLFEARFDALDDVIREMKQEEENGPADE